MFYGVTEEQRDLIEEVSENYENEFKRWADKNESQLMKWYDENEHNDWGLFERTMRFAYYCSNKFMEWKSSNSEEA